MHPKIKDLMAPYILKFKAVMLNRLLSHTGLTIEDLPTLPGSDTKICYNYILGKCVHKGCLNKAGHLDVTKITDEFAVALVDKVHSKWARCPKTPPHLTGGARSGRINY